MTYAFATLAFTALNQQASTSRSVSDNGREDIHSTTFLAVQGLAEQGRSYHISCSLFKLITHQMNAQDISTLLSVLGTQDIEVGSKRWSAEHMQAEYPINIVDIAQHPEQRRLSNMIQEYSEKARYAQQPQGSDTAGS